MRRFITAGIVLAFAAAGIIEAAATASIKAVGNQD